MTRSRFFLLLFFFFFFFFISFFFYIHFDYFSTNGECSWRICISCRSHLEYIWKYMETAQLRTICECLVVVCSLFVHRSFFLPQSLPLFETDMMETMPISKCIEVIAHQCVNERTFSRVLSSDTHSKITLCVRPLNAPAIY